MLLGLETDLDLEPDLGLEFDLLLDFEFDLGWFTCFDPFLPVTYVLPLGVTVLIAGDFVSLRPALVVFFFSGVSGVTLLESPFPLLLTLDLLYAPAANGDFGAGFFLSGAGDFDLFYSPSADFLS